MARPRRPAITRLFAPILGLAVSLAALIGLPALLGSATQTNGPRSVSIVLWATVVLALLAVVVSIWSHPNYLRLVSLRADYPDDALYNVQIDSDSLRALAGPADLSLQSSPATRFTLGVGSTGLRLWDGGKRPRLVLSRDGKSLGVSSVDVIPSSGREAPNIRLVLAGGKPAYVQAMGPLGGFIPSRNSAAVTLQSGIRLLERH